MRQFDRPVRDYVSEIWGSSVRLPLLDAVHGSEKVPRRQEINTIPAKYGDSGQNRTAVIKWHCPHAQFQAHKTIPVWQWPSLRRSNFLESAGHVYYNIKRISWLVLITVTAGINLLRRQFIWETWYHICAVYLSSTWEYCRLWDLILREKRTLPLHTAILWLLMA